MEVEPVGPVQMKIYQSNTCRKDLSWVHFDDEPRVQERQQIYHMVMHCHVWGGAPSCYLELLDKLQKQTCRTLGPSLAAPLEPLVH